MFEPSADLTRIADGTEAVTFLRRGRTPGDSGTTIAHALRRAITAGQAAIVNRGDVHKSVASGGRCISADLVWHLPVSELPDAPQLGDMILDADNQLWTILVVKRATLGARWRCETRNVAVAYGLDDTISVLKATGVPGVWRTWLTGIRARIQPGEVKIYNDDYMPLTIVRYRIFLGENVTLDHTCRLRGADGTVYTPTASTGAERIGELQVVEAEVVVSG
jgi:hypothetical protein